MFRPPSKFRAITINYSPLDFTNSSLTSIISSVLLNSIKAIIHEAARCTIEMSPFPKRLERVWIDGEQFYRVDLCPLEVRSLAEECWGGIHESIGLSGDDVVKIRKVDRRAFGMLARVILCGNRRLWNGCDA